MMMNVYARQNVMKDVSQEMIEFVAKGIFLMEYPFDKWERFKNGDYAKNRYLEIAKEAFYYISVIQGTPSGLIEAERQLTLTLEEKREKSERRKT